MLVCSVFLVQELEEVFIYIANEVLPYAPFISVHPAELKRQAGGTLFISQRSHLGTYLRPTMSFGTSLEPTLVCQLAHLLFVTC